MNVIKANEQNVDDLFFTLYVILYLEKNVKGIFDSLVSMKAKQKEDNDVVTTFR